MKLLTLFSGVMFAANCVVASPVVNESTVTTSATNVNAQSKPTLKASEAVDLTNDREHVAVSLEYLQPQVQSADGSMSRFGVVPDQPQC